MAFFCNRCWWGVHKWSQSCCKVNTVVLISIICSGVWLGWLNVEGFKIFSLGKKKMFQFHLKTKKKKLFRINECVRAAFGNKNMILTLSPCYLVFLRWEMESNLGSCSAFYKLSNSISKSTAWEDFSILYC